MPTALSLQDEFTACALLAPLDGQRLEGTPMATAEFDPLGVVVDWLDACRARRLDQLLKLYEAGATLECACDGPCSYRGRRAIASYWVDRLDAAVDESFQLINIVPGEDPDCVVLDYLSYEGKPVRMHFTFAASGKIAATVCAPTVRSRAA